MKEEGIEPLKDWRGTPINIGDTVIYTASHGRSSSLVEATVKSFTTKARVILDVVRESFGYREGKPVNVGADRVTVVEKLARSSVPTLREKRIVKKRRLVEMYEQHLVDWDNGVRLDRSYGNRENYWNREYIVERLAEVRKDLQDALDG